VSKTVGRLERQAKHAWLPRSTEKIARRRFHRGTRPESDTGASTRKKRDQREDQEDHEEDFCDPGRGPGKSSEAEDCRDNGNNKKNKCVTEHGFGSFLVWFFGVVFGLPVMGQFAFP